MERTSSLAAPHQRWYLLALAALCLAISVQYSFKAVNHRSALVRWQSALTEFDAGENIYQKHLHPNSPMLLLLLKPLLLGPPLASALTWFYLKVGMAVCAVFWVFRILEVDGSPFPPWAKGLTVLLSLRPILGDLTHGNVNLFILFLVIAALFAVARGREFSAGLLLALAIACKVTPALFVPYFLWKRAWRVLAGCAIGLGLFVWPGLVPGTILGMDRYADLLQSWIDAMIRPYLVSGVVFYSEHNNQSLPGLLFRLLTPSASFSTYVNDIYTPLEYHNFITVGPDVVRWLVRACQVGFVCLVIAFCRTPLMRRGGPRLAAEYSLILLGMLLFSERTWKHHCVTLLLPFAVICHALAESAPGTWRRWHFVGTLAGVVQLMASTASGFGSGWNRVADLAEVYGAYVGAFLLLGQALVVLLATKRTDGTEKTKEDPIPFTRRVAAPSMSSAGLSSAAR